VGMTGLVAVPHNPTFQRKYRDFLIQVLRLPAIKLERLFSSCLEHVCGSCGVIRKFSADANKAA
jgi:hypothetical protein